MDFATFAGLALAVAGIVGGLLLEKGSIQDVAQGTATLIVLGGTTRRRAGHYAHARGSARFRGLISSSSNRATAPRNSGHSSGSRPRRERTASSAWKAMPPA